MLPDLQCDFHYFKLLIVCVSVFSLLLVFTVVLFAHFNNTSFDIFIRLVIDQVNFVLRLEGWGVKGLIYTRNLCPRVEQMWRLFNQLVFSEHIFVIFLISLRTTYNVAQVYLIQVFVSLCSRGCIFSLQIPHTGLLWSYFLELQGIVFFVPYMLVSFKVVSLYFDSFSERNSTF